ncbi:MAG TPA: HDOD domain-containing protein [Fimbriimonadaceae bacterium]|nr:HDOD domain-containing protein [Fimbriimonadaceae bacterium]
MKYDFERLKLLCGRATCLPPLPASVFRLMEVTESSEFSANQIAAITSADPMLCAKLMRAANAGWDFAGMSRITSVQGAVMRLGLQAVRAMAISLGVQAMFTSRLAGCLFDPLCYARHSIVVGLLGRYIFARCQMRGDVQSSMKVDEVFAAGVLHDLPVALLAWVSPDAYDHVHVHCKGQGIAIEHGFKDIYGGSIRELGTRAIQTWGLPEAFEHTTLWVDEPLRAENEHEAIMAIHMASAVADTNIADSNGFASAPWSCPVEIDPEILMRIDLEQEELDTAFAAVLNQIEFYLPSSAMSSAVYLRGRRVA